MADVAVRLLGDALRDRYRFERELGTGGMATVWLAHDLKHERRVAIKILHPELAAVLGTERFLAEIKVTANLQHPHILPLFDSGQANGQLYYVMPYVEGESLRTRLAREKQLPIDEAIRITREVASALDYAHRRGVIHRDIKPENILLQDGTALVADFGIALAVSKAGGARLTQTGLSLGTPQYMSPEQATGDHVVDGRSDIYSLGAALYEMLTGDPPFTGSTAQAIVAKLLTERPADVRRSRSTVPESVDEAVLTALAKLPADRFASAAEFAQALESGTLAGRLTPGRPTIASAVARRSRLRWAGVPSLLAAFAVLAALAAWGWFRPPPEGPVTRSLVTLEGFYADDPADFDVPAISPDGSRIAYNDKSGRLLVLDQDQVHPKPIPGTENTAASFFSPDGKNIGFLTGFPGALKLVSLDGGVPQTLVSDSVSGWGGSWGDDGWIYFMTGVAGTLRRIRSTGGASELVAQTDSTRDELLFRWPNVLPGGRAVLVTIDRRSSPSDIGIIDTRSHQVRVLTQGVRAVYARSGHLIYVRRNGELMASGFDAKQLSLTGRPVRIDEGIALTWGAAAIGLSQNGTLLYARYSPKAEVLRVSRDGHEQVVDSAWTGQFVTPALSPNGDRLAVGVQSGGSLELWVKQLDHGVFTRLASGGTENYRPAWSPDGVSLLFSSDRGGIREQLFKVPADGSGPPRLLIPLKGSIDEGLWSHDGQWLLYRTGSGSRRDIFAMRLGVDSSPAVPLAATEAEEYSPALSPEGQWLAYTSQESGRPEVYVRPFPDVGVAREQVSREGGTEPLWGHAGRELFYRNERGYLVAVQFTRGAAFKVLSQKPLFNTSGYSSQQYHAAYAVTPDDQAFYFIRQLPGPPPQIVLVRNWFQELKAEVRP
jgi:eukaryotic-like serine/threonine-protein kinase